MSPELAIMRDVREELRSLRVLGTTVQANTHAAQALCDEVIRLRVAIEELTKVTVSLARAAGAKL